MLRITRLEEAPSMVVLKVEGWIASDWIPVLENECFSLLQDEKQVVLDLADVTFVDSRGVESLKRLRIEDLRLTNCPPLIEDLMGGCDSVPSLTPDGSE